MFLTALLFTPLEGFLKDLSQQTHFAISTLLLFKLGAAGTKNRRGLYLKSRPEHCALHSQKETGRPFPTPSQSLGKEVSTALCLAVHILLLRKQIALPIARVRSKLILLMLLTFSPGFLRSEVLQTPTQHGWIAAKAPAWTLTKILGKSLPCTCVLPSISPVYSRQAFRSMNTLSLPAWETPSMGQSFARAFSTRARGDTKQPLEKFSESMGMEAEADSNNPKKENLQTPFKSSEKETKINVKVRWGARENNTSTFLSLYYTGTTAQLCKPTSAHSPGTTHPPHPRCLKTLPSYLQIPCKTTGNVRLTWLRER